MAGAGVTEINLAGIGERHRKCWAFVQTHLNVVVVQLGDGGIFAVGDAAEVVGFAPLQAVAGGDGAGLGAVGTHPFPAARVELEPSSVVRLERQAVIVDGGQGQITLGMPCRLLPRVN
jgi:hypothetical protein